MRLCERVWIVRGCAWQKQTVSTLTLGHAWFRLLSQHHLADAGAG